MIGMAALGFLDARARLQPVNREVVVGVGELAAGLARDDLDPVRGDPEFNRLVRSDLPADRKM